MPYVLRWFTRFFASSSVEREISELKEELDKRITVIVDKQQQIQGIYEGRITRDILRVLINNNNAK